MGTFEANVAWVWVTRDGDRRDPAVLARARGVTSSIALLRLQRSHHTLSTRNQSL